jgi:hypothetical protein
MHLISLRAKANEGWDDGKLITILQLEGDPLNLEASGSFDLEIEVMIPSTHIQKSQEPVDVSDADVRRRKRAHAAKHNIKWGHLTCMLNLAPCTGPDCNTYSGAMYIDCPHVKGYIPTAKYDHLTCIDTNGMCIGPVCSQFQGLTYIDCPKAKDKI